MGHGPAQTALHLARLQFKNGPDFPDTILRALAAKFLVLSNAWQLGDTSRG